MPKEIIRVSVTLIGSSLKPYFEISSQDVPTPTLEWFKKVFRENVPAQMEKLNPSDFHVLPHEEEDAIRTRIAAYDKSLLPKETNQ
jgi:hypothetical protein